MTDKCQVRNCNNQRHSSRCEVLLVKDSGDEFLFSAWFCEIHIHLFHKAHVLLTHKISVGDIEGVDPDIITGRL